jgi:hypothetical protein
MFSQAWYDFARISKKIQTNPAIKKWRKKRGF